MNTRRRAAALLLALGLARAAAFAGPSLSGADHAIRRYALTGGGTLSSAAGYALNSGAAESGVSSFTGAGLRLHSGLMNIVAQPGSVVSITALSKSSGTLELAWAAPGLDGALGDVTAGSYRIDTTSDPLNHSFAPTSFVTEFATSVVAGEAQSYTLTGLEPNTTYYTRIYLADARKVFAETSVSADESTLADLPGTPSLAAVYYTSATFSWTVPPKGAEGYALDGSSTNFGALLPGGIVKTSATRDGLQVSLTVTGLYPNTTYYFRLASLNWQDDLNYVTILATKTLEGGIPPLDSVALSGNRLLREVILSWSSPEFPDASGVLVQMSTSDIVSEVVNGVAYEPGTALPDGSVILSSAAATTFREVGLDLDTTYYFRLHNKDSVNTYSLALSTYVILDIPPMSPAALARHMSADGSSVTLTWASVLSNLDGTMFKNLEAPHPWEIQRYEVSRATGIFRSNWVTLTTTSINTTMLTTAVPDPNQVYYYKIEAKDAFGPDADAAMVIDTLGNVYAVSADRVSRLKIPSSLASNLYADGKPLLLRTLDTADDLNAKTFRSVHFQACEVPTGKPVSGFQLTAPQADVVLRYETSGGRVVPSANGEIVPEAGLLAAASPSAGTSAAQAADQLGMFWNNGRDYVKLYGRVDTADQTVSVQTALTGDFQVRSLLREQAFGFDISDMSNKAITPNGDGLNDTVVWRYENPKYSAVSGKIFDLRGGFVADMRAGSATPDSLLWDGKAGGAAVPGGIYIYQITAEGRTFNGTVLVIR